MQFNSWDLGQRRAGEVVEINLTGSAANVRLLDTANLNAFKNGRSARGVGGHATSRRCGSPSRPMDVGTRSLTTAASPDVEVPASGCCGGQAV